MIVTIKKTRDIVLKHIMQKICNNEMDTDAGLKLMATFEEEYELALDCVARYEKACFQITENRTVIIGGK